MTRTHSTRFSEIVTTNKDPNIVATAANMLAPFVHSKRGTLPAPRFVPDTNRSPHIQHRTRSRSLSCAHPGTPWAKANRFANPRLNSAHSLKIGWILSTLARSYDIKLRPKAGAGILTIRIEGGMPALPGTNIIMDDTALGRVIEHEQPPALNGHNGITVIRPKVR